MLPWSVIPIAGCPSAAAAATTSSTRAAPSSIEYSVCTWRWVKESPNAVSRDLAPDRWLRAGRVVSAEAPSPLGWGSLTARTQGPARGRSEVGPQPVHRRCPPSVDESHGCHSTVPPRPRPGDEGHARSAITQQDPEGDDGRHRQQATPIGPTRAGSHARARWRRRIVGAGTGSDIERLMIGDDAADRAGWTIPASSEHAAAPTGPSSRFLAGCRLRSRHPLGKMRRGNTTPEGEPPVAMDLLIEVDNEPGALAAVATAVSDAGVNIAAATFTGSGHKAELPHPRAARRGRPPRPGHLEPGRDRRARGGRRRRRGPPRRAGRHRPPGRAAGVNLDLLYIATGTRVVLGSPDLDGLKRVLAAEHRPLRSRADRRGDPRDAVDHRPASWAMSNPSHDNGDLSGIS